MKKIAVATLLGGAVVSAGMVLAPTASAGAGISFQGPVGGEIGIGDHGAGDTDLNGARATAKDGFALAVNTGLPTGIPHGSSATAGGGAFNTAVAIDGHAVSNGFDNHTFAGLGASVAQGSNNNVVTVAGSSTLVGDQNQVVNFGRGALGQGDNSLSLNACSVRFSFQADHINTNLPPGGAC